MKLILSKIENKRDILSSKANSYWMNNWNMELCLDPYKSISHLSATFPLIQDYMTEMTYGDSILLESICKSYFWDQVNGGTTFYIFA